MTVSVSVMVRMARENGNMATADQTPAATTTVIAATDMTTRLDDMTASFEINTIRLNRCRRRANAAAGACAGASANTSNASMYARRSDVASTVNSSTISSRAWRTLEMSQQIAG